MLRVPINVKIDAIIEIEDVTNGSSDKSGC